MSKERKTMSARNFTAGLVAALGLTFFAASPAMGAATIDTFTTTTSSTQAGDHPDLETVVTLHNPGLPEAARNVVFEAPEGIFGNPQAVTRCIPADFASDVCPVNSQVGVITVRGNYSGNPNFVLGTAPVFSINPQDTETAKFSFKVPTVNIPVNIPVTVRTGSDYGLRFSVQEISQIFPMANFKLTFWGFPALTSHDAERFKKGTVGNPPGCPGAATASCVTANKSSEPVRPLTSNPTVCTGSPLTSEIQVQTYQDPDHIATAQASYPPVTGCNKLVFNPVLSADPTTNETDSASGLDLILNNQQFLNFSASPSQIRSLIVTLPDGLTINPDAADGQTACSDADANFDNDAPADCPDSSKIGNFELGTPALEGPLTGSLYIGDPQPGNQYRLFMVANGFGIHAKLHASVRPDPVTGQVSVEMIDLPQVPFDTFSVHLFASDRGLMATPTQCHVYDVSARFFPWDAELPDQTSSQIFALESGPGGTSCPGVKRSFKPRLVAGTSNPTAGAFSDFFLKLDRDDGDQFLGDLNFKMPPGFTGDLRGIAYCPEGAIRASAQNLGRAEQAVPSCPASSQIGTSNVAAGPGGHPFHAVGRMYLAGPFKGAPLSLVAVTPALAGPYDYGVVVVRVALHIDPLTAQVSAVSDTVPSIIGGIPIRMRSIQVNIDKPNFTINPTSCVPNRVDSEGIGDQGTIAAFASPFTAVNCATLPFKPGMTVRQIGRKTTRRSTNPQLQFDLRTRPGDANIKSLSVTLSHAFEIDQRHLGNICSEKELAADQCAGRTPIGNASTTTPLLDQPLSGPVYAVSGSGGLPRLAFILNGQVNLVPRADTKTTSGGQLKTTVPVIPDAPIGHFRLNVFGGKTGYLINTRNICIHIPVTRITYTAQNGKTRTEAVKLKAACGKENARRKRGT